SAQSFPSDQTDAWAIKLAREAAFAHSSDHAYLPQTREETNSWQPHEWVVAAIQAAATSAPKPHDQEPITVEAVAEIFNHPEYGLSINWLLENGIGELQVGDVLMVSDRAITDKDGSGEVYAVPPAQKPAQVYLDGLDRALGEAIDQRDHYHEVADELAARIAAITGVDIGEHSSANCPWQSAIEAAEEYKPVQAVDLGAERMFYIQDTRQFVGNCPMWWGPNGSGYVTRLDEAGRYTEQEAIKQNRTRDTDIPWPCAEIDAIARRTVDGQHMRPRAERLAELALVDSQAVGNG
ncbi:hypothetical protein, partial [Bacillus altitudinis]